MSTERDQTLVHTFHADTAVSADATGSWSSDFSASTMQTSATGSWRSRMTPSAGSGF
ncbi:hypothetical protein PC116_g28166 [Phytophthora cactorum]|uniref:Uncharacterized protein n=1 Tax=Phytophthora cactorum TaxID=29920 RepID=A0A8T1AL63_9STRA|nr:hypothetical protein PC117_g26331 [Phytophthora cactorum]KAG2961403.1 hypothetical protein PC119_g26121 [Phytophthora cactorum]KAG4223367.1 hypothetical protein PC116_g28166 [Phytophthora cactorum]